MAKYQKYAEYKDSGVEWVDDIPSTWEVKPVFALFTPEMEKNLDGIETNVLSLSYGRIIQRDVENNHGLLPESFNTYQIVNDGDIILRLTDLQNDKRSLRVGLATQKGIITSAYLKLSALKEIDPKFAYRLLHSYDTTKVFYGMGGGLRQSMKFEDFRRLPILVPPKSEQTQIANFLDHETAKIDSLIAKQEKLIELLKEKRQAVISHAVTKGLNPDVNMKDSGVEWLGQVPEHWGIWKFSHIAPIITCGVASTPTYVDESEGMPFLSAQNIKNNKLSLHKFNHIPYELHEQLTRYRRPERGDILVTRVGAGIGEACIVDIDLEFSIYVSLTHIRVRPEIAHNKFIMYFFGTDYCKFLNFDGTVTGGGVGNLNVNNVVKYRIALPTIEEQKQITDYLDNYIEKQDQLIAKAQSAIQLMQERRTALISSAVTGKIDVRNWQDPNEAKTELSL
ncbi:hypothetical protein GS19_04460 [Acinetobacter idrijaensis]|nr:hypothetical protein GS19_04460 [Acinetobacter idrijaensis]